MLKIIYTRQGRQGSAQDAAQNRLNKGLKYYFAIFYWMLRLCAA